MFQRSSLRSLLTASAGIALLNGCTVGPDYQQPDVAKPVAYKEGPPWKEAQPRDAISKGDWYTVFHDSKLNELESQAQKANQNLRAAVARVSEARAVARQAEADFYPTLDFAGSGSRQRTSPNDGQLQAEAGGVAEEGRREEGPGPTPSIPRRWFRST